MTRHWQLGAVLAESREEETVLRHLGSPAALHVVGGRLRPGAGYATAPRAARRELARTGAILRLRTRGAYLLHASGVVDPNGSAWILTGESGAGKSTLAFALARYGWRVLGDDGVVVRTGTSGSLMALGWRDPLRMSSSLFPVFPELVPLEPLVDERDPRRRVPVNAPFAAGAPLAGCVFLERGEHDGATRLGETDVMAKLIVQSPWVLIPDAHARAHFEALRQFALTVPCWRLMNTERQLRDIPTTLEALVS